MTCKAVNVSDAANKHPEKSTYDYNENVTYTCDTGFEHTAGNLTRTCTAIDNWSGNEPTCTSR